MADLCRMNTSSMLLVPGHQFDAADVNATNRPPVEIAGEELTLLCPAP
jgi:hypothetical protein